MQIKQAQFVRSVSSRENHFNTELPEIALVGKSNVGKSSLVNHILGEKRVIVSDSAGSGYVYVQLWDALFAYGCADSG